MADHACIDMQELGAKLQDARDAGLKLIVSDGVFSMDGSITPLQCVRACVCVCMCQHPVCVRGREGRYFLPFCREICQLAAKEKALVFLDECHATGFLGDSGR